MKLHVPCRWHCCCTGNLLFPFSSYLLIPVWRPGKAVPWHNLNIKKDAWLMPVHMQHSTEMCLLTLMLLSVCAFWKPGCSAMLRNRAPAMPGDIPVVLSPKTDVQMKPALFSVLTAFIWELSKLSLVNELFLVYGCFAFYSTNFGNWKGIHTCSYHR